MIARADLGGLHTSVLGLGCMSMSEFYGPADWDCSTAAIRSALDAGVTLIDTADMYGDGHNEVLVGRAVVGRRHEVQLSTKFGIDRRFGDHQRVVRGHPDYVRRACDASLLRLGAEWIDLWFLHRPPTDVPIEETVAAMAEEVDAGKVRYLGLSGIDDEALRRAYAVHPIAAIQEEYSVWHRRKVEALATTLRELGVGLVGYRPLGGGFLVGAFDPEAIAPGDTRRGDSRVSGVGGRDNRELRDAVALHARRLRITPAQLLLSWARAQVRRLGVSIVPLPGARNEAHVRENVVAAHIELDPDVVAALEHIHELVKGDRQIP